MIFKYSQSDFFNDRSKINSGQIWKDDFGTIITIKDRVPKFNNDNYDFDMWYADVQSEHSGKHEEALSSDLILSDFNLVSNARLSSSQNFIKTASVEDQFIKENNDKKDKINLIANALKSSALEAKNTDVKLQDGSVQQVTQTINPFGREVYVVSNNNKNTVTFSTKKQLIDYLKED